MAGHRSRWRRHAVITGGRLVPRGRRDTAGQAALEWRVRCAAPARLAGRAGCDRRHASRSAGRVCPALLEGAGIEAAATPPPEANQILAPLSAEHHFYGLAREELGSVIDTAAGRYKTV